MKPSHTYIQADQAYIRWKEQQQAKRERNSILRFAAFLLIGGITVLYVTLTIVAHTPTN